MKVHIGDSAVRDGLQSVRGWVPTDVKLQIIDKLVAAGITEIQAASFVHPKLIPQMQDGEEVFVQAVKNHPDVKFTALVPNLKGVERALSVDCKYLGGSFSTTEEHNKANFNMSIAKSFDQMDEIMKIKGDANYSFSQICTFVCPFTGPVNPLVAVRQLGEVMNHGVKGLCVCDTTGTANPKMIRDFFTEFQKAFPGVPMPTVHLHDTHGMGLANTLAALDFGVTNFSTCTGGIGGCPYTPGAMGNVATEDMVGMFHGMGIETGVDMDKLMEAAVFIRAQIGSTATASSHRAIIKEKEGSGCHNVQ